VPTSNAFEELEEEHEDDENNNIRVEKKAKHPSTFVARVNNFSLLSQLLKEIATDEYEIKVITFILKKKVYPICYI